MAKINKPDVNVQAFAIDSTTRRVFGTTTTQSDELTANYNAALREGWETTLVPPREWFEGSQFTSSQHLAYLAQRGVPEWVSTQEYYHPAFVTGSDNALYASVQDNTGQDPVTDGGTNWVNYADSITPPTPDTSLYYAPQSIVQANMGTRPAGFGPEDVDLPTDSLSFSGGIVTIETGLQVAYVYNGIVYLSELLSIGDTVDLSAQADGTYYIYADLDSDGLFTGFNFSTTPQNVGFDRIDVGSDLYNPATLTMVNSADAPIRRVYIGEATVAGSVVTDVFSYALGAYTRIPANGGANIVNNFRYVERNPFGVNDYINVRVDVFVNSKWAEPGWLYVSDSQNADGVRAGSSSTEGIVIQTGNRFLYNQSQFDGNLLGVVTSGASELCRLRVRRAF